MSKVVIGIDPGIADTGYGVIKEEKGKLICISYGSIKTKAGEDLIDRLDLLYRELNKIVKKYKPQAAAMEQLFFNKNVRTAITVGQARGVSLLVLSQNKLKVKDVSPTQVKQAVTTYGRASKKQVQNMVKLILNLNEIPQPDDAADALAIAICALNYSL